LTTSRSRTSEQLPPTRATPRERPASASELAAIYSALAQRRPDSDASAPCAVFNAIGAGASASDRLHRFGLDVHLLDEPALRRGTCLLGGAMHGTWIAAGPTEEEHGEDVASLVERSRLREWAGDAAGDPSFSTLHTPGSDSRGVVQFRLGDAEIVAKIGAADAIAGESRFASEVNALMVAAGLRGLFPAIHGLRLEGAQGVSLMEAGEPLAIGPLFADQARTTLAADALDRLDPHLTQLASWYELTAADRRPTVADYLYRERYHVLREHPELLATFRARFGDSSPEDVFAVPVRLPAGLVVPAYDESVAWLGEIAPELLPDRGSAVHGDIYAANMLVLADGNPVLIDPRPVWEGRNRPDVGYGDPVFDLATLLHGVFPMAAILHAAKTATSAELFGDEVRPGGGVLDLSSLRLPVDFPPAVRALEARMLDALPHDEPQRHVTTRLYVGAATSLAGWLKYERSMPTPEVWLATLGYVTWYLWRARQAWEDHSSNGRRTS
jgi:hypothetical protein